LESKAQRIIPGCEIEFQQNSLSRPAPSNWVQPTERTFSILSDSLD